MRCFHPKIRAALTLCLGAALSFSVVAAELSAAQLAQIQQRLNQNLPDFPPIDGGRTTPIAGLVELRSGGHILYTDTKGEYLLQGELVETSSRRNLTQERMDELNKIDFATLPLKDTLVWKNGTGKRRLVVFADPNCGYCKRLEKDLQQVKDVTVYTFLIAILGEDSAVKSNDIWCVKNRTEAYRNWMLKGTVPPKSMGMCSTPLQRNVALAQRLNVNGTPAMFFEDGTRLPSAAPAAVIEQRLEKASVGK